MRLRSTRPNQGNNPPDHRPPEQQVHQQYSREIRFVPPDNRRQEIEERCHNQKCHRFTCSRTCGMNREASVYYTPRAPCLFPARYLHLRQYFPRFSASVPRGAEANFAEPVFEPQDQREGPDSRAPLLPRPPLRWARRRRQAQELSFRQSSAILWWRRVRVRRPSASPKGNRENTVARSLLRVSLGIHDNVAPVSTSKESSSLCIGASKLAGVTGTSNIAFVYRSPVARMRALFRRPAPWPAIPQTSASVPPGPVPIPLPPAA